MSPTKRVAGIVGVLAGVSFMIVTGPAAIADQTKPSNPQASPCVTPSPEPSTPRPDASPTAYAAHLMAVGTAKPDSTGNGGSNGKSDKPNKGDTAKGNGATNRDQTKDKAREADCVQDANKTAEETRAELRERIRLNGGSWGSFQRQGSLVKVADQLAARYAAGQDVTNPAALGRILTLINLWLPKDLQVDVTALLARYGLTPADVKWPGGVNPVPSPSPSVSPTPTPSASI
jgi:hypothetical protein